MTTLVVVESPTKAKALRKYLGSGYIVRASMGHVRDLPPKELGVDVERRFRPSYRLVSGARKTIAGLRSALADASIVILATDPDREGEAIAWHLMEACKRDLQGKQVLRARFHEITPDAVRAAIANPQQLNMDLVNAQQARRVLDRLVGYQVSPLLWRGIDGPKGLSAGRVQSVALRLVVERDRDIDAFEPEEYWSLTAELSKRNEPHFKAQLFKVGGKKASLKSEAEATAVMAALDGANWSVGSVTQRERRRKPFPPYITSSLQRDAAVRLKWGAKKTMQIAQQLYEGVTLPEEGQVGLITYMRTDSTNVSPEAQQQAREVIRRFFGDDALPAASPTYKSKVKNAQEAHEAIRPTNPARLPKTLRGALSPDQDALYTLIWRRFIASQMKPAQYNVTTVLVLTAQGAVPLPYVFRATGRQLLEAGFLQVYDVQDEKEDENTGHNDSLPPLANGDPLLLHALTPKQHFTKPPPHYNDSALIQAMERLGIGRPSTFASIVDTLYRRGYVEKQGKAMKATALGGVVRDFVVRYFPEMFEVDYTAKMEARLDDISNGDKAWIAVMDELWTPFAAQLETAEGKVAAAPKVKVAYTPTQTGRSGRPRKQRRSKPAAKAIGRDCPKCGKPLVQRTGKRGAFVGCSGYPDCRHTERLAG